MNNYYYIDNVNVSTNSILSQAPQLITFAKRETTPYMKNPQHMHSHLEIFYYVEGEGFFEFENHIHPVKSGTLVIVNSNTEHIQYPKDSGKTITSFILSIDKLNIYGLPANCLSLDGVSFVQFENHDNSIYRILNMMHEELEAKSPDYYTKVIALLYELLVDTQRLFKNITQPRNQAPTPSIIYNIKNYIDSHFMDDLTLEDLAKRTYLHKNYFLKQFKKYFKQSPMQYMMTVRLEHAKLLLTKTELSISEIALSLQFSNFSYFSEIFKKHFGVTPTDFRRQIKHNITKLPTPSADT